MRWRWRHGPMALCRLRADSGCVCAAPGPCPSARACCRTAAWTGSAAAARGSGQTCSPTARSLFRGRKHLVRTDAQTTTKNLKNINSLMFN